MKICLKVNVITKIVNELIKLKNTNTLRFISYYHFNTGLFV